MTAMKLCDIQIGQVMKFEAARDHYWLCVAPLKFFNLCTDLPKEPNPTGCIHQRVIVFFIGDSIKNHVVEVL